MSGENHATVQISSPDALDVRDGIERSRDEDPGGHADGPGTWPFIGLWPLG